MVGAECRNKKGTMKNVCKMSLGENGIKIADDVRVRCGLILDGFRMDFDGGAGRMIPVIVLGVNIVRRC